MVLGKNIDPSIIQLSCLSRTQSANWQQLHEVAMGGKRPSNGTSNRAPKKPKALDDLGDAVEKEKGVIATLPFWDTLMNQVDETFTKFGSISEFFMKSFPTLEERKALSQTLIDHFGATETLDSDFTAGIKSFGLWQICPHIEAGNKGLVINQFHKHLIMLILIQGPRTDAATSPGVEYPVIQPLVEAYFDTPWETSSLQAGTYDCQSIGFVKGWTRCVAALFAAHLLIQNDLVEHYRDHLPEAYKNFCLLKGLVTADYASELDRINANRGSLVKVWVDDVSHKSPQEFGEINECYLVICIKIVLHI